MIAIAAMSRNRAIGLGGRIPWHLPEDLKFFKHTTLGHIVLMGRKTYESIGKPLPGRENWVLSRTAEIPGVRVIRSLEEIPAPPEGKNLYLVGGAELYTALLPRCTEILLTRVNLETPGDAFFPDFEPEFDEGEIILATDQFEIRRHRRTTG
ncbi:MAG: dihydrofolate reductase [Verrucomicrobiota bacterium]